MSVVGQVLTQKLQLLEKVDRKKFQGQLQLEFDMRMLLNVLVNLLFYNNDDPSLADEFTSDRIIQVEKMCLQAVQISLELAIVPIRKFLIIFYIYLRMLFGSTVVPGPDRGYEKKDFKNLQYNKDLYARFLAESYPGRYNLKTDHPVEKFYKRHMNQEMLIPQVIVVGILRVLLTTCPNNARNSGGIDLNSEWSACVSFMVANKEWFLENNFVSKGLPILDTLLRKEEEIEKPLEEKSDEENEEDNEPHYSGMPEFQGEVDRHRVITAMIISDFFLYLLKHLKGNHVIQFVYVS